MPDQEPDGAEVFREMQEARAVLIDTVRHQLREISSATRVDDTIVAAHDMNLLFEALRNISKGIPA